MANLVLIGGGHAHVEVLRRFGMEPLPDVQLTLVSPHPDTPYSGMLPGWIAGHYTRDQCHIDLERLTRFARCRLVRAACNGINTGARLVFCDNGEILRFDTLSIDTGGRSPAFDTPGALDHALAVKPVAGFVTAWDALCERAARGDGPARIAMVGAGAAGTEVLLSMQHRLRQLAPAATAEFVLLSDSDTILPGHCSRVQALFRQVLEQRGIRLSLGHAVEHVDRGRLRLSGGETLSADVIVWATGTSAPLWPGASGLATDQRGFILVDDCLQSVSHPGIFAAGDIASVRDHPRPKSGVYAVRAGPVLCDNLRNALLDRPLRPWRPQPRALALISTGNRYAIASRGNLALAGAWVWTWKDGIDRRFMRRYAV